LQMRKLKEREFRRRKKLGSLKLQDLRLKKRLPDWQQRNRRLLTWLLKSRRESWQRQSESNKNKKLPD
jgi:hypothetical protein